MSFSVKSTGRALFSFEPTENDDEIIYCIYGLKGLATICLFFSFKVLMIGHLPFTNRVHLTEVSLVCRKYECFKYDSDISVAANELTAECFPAHSCFVHGRVPVGQRLLCRIQDE